MPLLGMLNLPIPKHIANIHAFIITVSPRAPKAVLRTPSHQKEHRASISFK
jgi:hypothetical protein